MKRRPMSRKGSQSLFTRTAKKVHHKNGTTVLRGGIRL